MDKTLSDYDAKISQISDTRLTNPAQKVMFQRQSQEQRYALESHLNAYEGHQLEAYAGQVVSDTLDSATTAAVNGRTLPPEPGVGSVVDHQHEVGLAALSDYADAHYPPDKRAVLLAQQTAQFNSKFYSSLADDALTAGDTGYVKQLLADHGQEIDPKQRGILTKALNTTDMAQRSTAKMFEIAKPDADGKVPTLADQLDRADKDPERLKDADLRGPHAGAADEPPRGTAAGQQRTAREYQQRLVQGDGQGARRRSGLAHHAR